MEPNVATAAKPVKIPGPDHPITIEHNPARIVITLAGRVVADTREALTLREAAYPAVQYIPRKDVDMSLLARTDHTTYLPIQRRLHLFQHPARRSALGQRGVELRGSLRRRHADQGLSRLLSQSRRRDRRTARGLNENDGLRDESEVCARKLTSAGAPVAATRYLGTIHDLSC
jgi:acetyl esterase/lipase